ncbi:MAG: hypothetical protein ACSLFI_10600 [Solirubrobacterales bacterium]
MRIRYGLLGLLAFALLAAPMATPASADAKRNRIVLNRSIAGVKIGVSVNRLHSILGQPNAVRFKRNEITGSMRFDYYGKLSYSSYAGTVLGMKTTRRSIRTKSGIGVGTSKRRLNRRFPGLSCYGPICSIVAGGGVATIGRRVTSFRIRNGKVRSVTVGRVID